MSPASLKGLAAAILTIAAAGCAGTTRVPPVLVPPQIDLRNHEVIGVVQFDTTAKGELGPLTTRRFVEEARRDQGLVRIVDLGTVAEALRSVGRQQLDDAALRELGNKRGVSTIVIGDLTVSKVRPDVRLNASLLTGGVTAEVEAVLSVKLVETSSGASIWSRSATATHNVANIGMWGGETFTFNAADPQKAYGGLVDDLVGQVAVPFQNSWRQP